MYKNIVLKFLTFDLALCLFWIGFGIWMIWMGIKNLKKAANPKIFFTVAILFILVGLFSLYFKRINLYDYCQYLRKGDNYLKSDICKIIDIGYCSSGVSVRYIADIKCAPDKWYQTRLKPTYSLQGQTLRITYLPNSKMILGIQYLKYNK